MKVFNFLPLAILLLKGAVALPVVETVDDITPTTILESRAPTIHDLPTSDATCAGHKFTPKEMEAAAIKAVDLDAAGEKRGKAEYPHPFNNNEGLSFPNCAHPKNMVEYPILDNGKVYDGGRRNKKQGGHRVVIDITSKGNDATFCGVITHPSKDDNTFVLCT